MPSVSIFFWVTDVLDVKVSEAMRETSFVTRFVDNRNHGFDRDQLYLVEINIGINIGSEKSVKATLLSSLSTH